MKKLAMVTVYIFALQIIAAQINNTGELEGNFYSFAEFQQAQPFSNQQIYDFELDALKKNYGEQLIAERKEKIDIALNQSQNLFACEKTILGIFTSRKNGEVVLEGIVQYLAHEPIPTVVQIVASDLGTYGKMLQQILTKFSSPSHLQLVLKKDAVLVSVFKARALSCEPEQISEVALPQNLYPEDMQNDITNFKFSLEALPSLLGDLLSIMQKFKQP